MDIENENFDEEYHLDDVIKPETKINNIYISKSEIRDINIDRFVTDGLHIKYSRFNKLKLIKSYTSKIDLEELHNNLELNENICCINHVIDSLDTIRKEIINPDDIDTNIPINKCDVSFNKVEGNFITIKDLYIRYINITYSNFHTLNLINLNLDSLELNFNCLHYINIQNCNIKNIKVKNSELHSINMCLESTIKNIADKCSTFETGIYRPENKNRNIYKDHEDYKYSTLTGKVELT